MNLILSLLGRFKHLFGNKYNFPPFRENEQNTYSMKYGCTYNSK